MKPIQGCHLIKPEDLFWRPSNLMKIPKLDGERAQNVCLVRNPEKLRHAAGPFNLKP